MTAIPTVPLPPEGAVDLPHAMQMYLPREWARRASAITTQEDYRKEISVPPGGSRWPETDPRRVAAIKAERHSRSQAIDEELQSAWASLIAALLGALKSGALCAYTMPTTVDSFYSPR